MIKVIFLDAVGTLFDVKGSVGEIYGEFAKKAGVNVDAKAVNTAFFQAFKEAPAMAFPGADPVDLPNLEFAWWEKLAYITFERVGVVDQFPDFHHFFVPLYNIFSTAQPWSVYPDVVPALEIWRSHGIKLAVLSNFDSRLYPVLKALKLDKYFASVTISTEVGAAKPSPQIFQTAWQKHYLPADQILHIGDSFTADYEGALQAGLQSIWLDRHYQDTFPRQSSIHVCENLLECIDLVRDDF
jgi:putative hydrolase of the HAD superfamily